MLGVRGGRPAGLGHGLGRTARALRKAPAAGGDHEAPGFGAGDVAPGRVAVGEFDVVLDAVVLGVDVAGGGGERFGFGGRRAWPLGRPARRAGERGGAARGGVDLPERGQEVADLPQLASSSFQSTSPSGFRAARGCWAAIPA